MMRVHEALEDLFCEWGAYLCREACRIEDCDEDLCDNCILYTFPIPFEGVVKLSELLRRQQ